METILHKHHIVPRHSGGTDDPDNIVELTIEDHMIAHLVRWKMYKHHGDYLAYVMLAGICKQPIKWIEGMETQRKRMRENNPMSDPETAKRVNQQLPRRERTRQRMLKNNPMSNPETAKRVNNHPNRKGHANKLWERKRSGEVYDPHIRPITINGVEYFSLAEAKRETGLPMCRIRKYANGGSLKREHKCKKVSVMIHGVRYPTIKSAMEVTGLSRYSILKLDPHPQASLSGEITLNTGMKGSSP